MSGNPNDVAALLASITAGLQKNSAPAPSSLVPPPPAQSFPAPSSSGAIDLSQIRPTNSGSLSLGPRYDDRHHQDPYGRPDPYQDPYASRRMYDDRERSHDRYGMPGRYDDPYDRDPGRMMGRNIRSRDRSYSPPRRMPSAVDSNDKLTDPMMIDQGYVGLIIGKGGDTLRRVESVSGAKVQFLPESATPKGERLCNLIGTRRQTDTARRMIDEIVDENIQLKGPIPNAKHQLRGRAPPAAPQPAYDNTRLLQEAGTPDRTMMIMVPDKTVGLIIGRGGDNIKDLQAKSRAKINIVPADQSINGQRPINLIGERAHMDEARRLILQIVADDEAGIPVTRKPAAEAMGPGSRQEVLRVPQDAVGMIIGKGGENVRDMQTVSTCGIKVSSQNNLDYREITLTGTDATIAHAKHLINEKIELSNERNGRNSAPATTAYGSSAPAADYTQQYGSSSYGQASYGQPAASAAAPAGDDPYAPYGGKQHSKVFTDNRLRSIRQSLAIVSAAATAGWGCASMIRIFCPFI